MNYNILPTQFILRAERSIISLNNIKNNQNKIQVYLHKLKHDQIHIETYKQNSYILFKIIIFNSFTARILQFL